MGRVQIQLLQPDQSFTLVPGLNTCAIAERPALLTVRHAAADVFLDDSPVTMRTVGDARVATIDLQNQAGMHRIRLGSGISSISFDFVTETAKANWAEIQAMVAATRAFSTTNCRPFLYAGRNGNADLSTTERLVFWLRERAAEIASLVRAIDKSPASRSQPRLAFSTRSRGLDRRATASLIRERPHLLEASSDGGIVVGQQRYWPSMVRVREQVAIGPVIEHQRIRHFLYRISRIYLELALLDSTLRAPASDIAGLLSARLFYGLLPNHFASYGHQPSEIERRDIRYGRLRQLSAEFDSHMGVGDLREGIRAGIKETWEVYQCFAAHMVGEALSLEYVGSTRDLRHRDRSGASMKRGEVSLYYDVQLPSVVLQSWRATTSRPAGERPDVVVVDMARRQCILLDVKFSIDSAGRCRAEHLFEVQGYLNSYGVSQGGIIFPGSQTANSVSAASGFAVHELPLAAQDVIASPSTSIENLRHRLDRMWTPLP